MVSTIEQEGQPTQFPVSITQADIEVRLKDLKIKGRIGENDLGFYQKYYFDLLETYRTIEPKLRIEDHLIARLCQVLTNNGLITRESCQGHPDEEKLPFVYFVTRKASALKLVSKVVRAESPLKNFAWQISVYTGDLSKPVGYWLEPEPRVVTNLTQVHPKLIQDLDYLGLSIMSSFLES